MDRKADLKELQQVMNLRTTFPVNASQSKISYDTPVMFIGSCFSSEIGFRMTEGKMKVVINPTGTVYNPFSVGNAIDIILENRIFTEDDMYNYESKHISFSHSTDFGSELVSEALDKINTSNGNAHHFLKKARFLFISFGTASIYRFKESDKIVSNCHKLPQSFFSREMLTVEGIVSNWSGILRRLYSFNNELHVIFTISPVRHWKDGAHGNQVSKSTLFLAVEKLLEHQNVGGYFPAYELVMDDLRDYRFYAEDMLHPSQTAVEYIWKAFSDCYFDAGTIEQWKEVQGVAKAMNHRLLSGSPKGIREFANHILEKIAAIEKKNPDIDLAQERSYFLKMISG
jgi:hypothetical protein